VVQTGGSQPSPYSLGEIFKAWSPFLILTVLVTIWTLKPFKAAFAPGGAMYNFVFNFAIPHLDQLVIKTAPIVAAPTAMPAVFKLDPISATGTAIFLSALISMAVLKINVKTGLTTFKETLFELRWPILSIGMVLAFAFVTNYSGMSSTMALVLAGTGAAFPFFSPFLGWLGVFLTGSDTSSNALFSSLQATTAHQIGVNDTLLVAANTSGGVTGKMISPQSIAVACAATGLVGKESDLFRFTVKHSLFFATIVGLLIGAPVIRMRGDYLAIVTLGFGEIIRLLFMSDWLGPYFGGAQGITNVPGVDLGFATVKGTDPRSVFYLVLFFCVIAIYISWRLQASRLGRAWMAIREDEQVAEAMGINTVSSKLMAFVVGAVLAAFSGAVLAAKVGSVFPTSFMILISIIILVVVIVGGMGNIAGVMVGSFVLIGVLGGPKQPGLLQEFQNFKLLIYGMLLVFMMLKRPEGLVPSARRSRELHQEEFLQDAWLKGDKSDDDADDEDAVNVGDGGGEEE